ncbi:putative nucleolar complex protein 14, partial [Neolecta irregularis DAH-3]
MAKGNKSQLKQLKEELRDAGLRRGSKQCPATSSLQRDAQLHGIRSRFNPYGLKVTKQKHEIVGRSVRGVEGNPAVSKQISEDHVALHAELAARKKTGGLIDRRFGEDDPNMTPEEKMLERFTKEKQKRARNTDIFNLENDQLTHYGQALEDFDNYDDINSDDDNVNIDQIMVERTHFGGFETDTRKKTRSEIMEEIMTKSKQHKYERQKEKEDDELEREALDDELRDIRSLLAQLPNPVETPRDKTDEKYDEALREMIFDKRAKPTERLKTEEEIAEEEAEKLKKLEEDRLQRMRGEQVVEAEVKRRGPAVADDLDDDFASSEDEDMAYAFGKGLESHIDKNEDEDSTNCIIESEYNENLADEDSTNSIINESEYNGNLAEDSSN